MKKVILFFSLALNLLSACKRDDVVDEDNTYTLSPPSYFPSVLYPLENNPISKEGFELGKKLFNDPRLSIDNSVACSNCHVKAVAFTDPQHNPSVGVFEQSGTRNAPMIANMAFQSEFLLDGGVSHLDFIPVFAIENKKEMGETISNVVVKLNRTADYPALFKAAFAEIDTITSPYMLKAISQYMLLLISDNAKYDQMLRGEIAFSEEELQGQTIFNEKCATCHAGALFTNHQFINNGLDTTFADIGRALITETNDDLGKFKVPSLRNSMLTAPYMHDGRFKTIREVLDHYRFHVKNSPTLANELHKSGQLGISLTDEEVDNIILFLETLTDYEFIANPKF
ncbi:MAG: cytochrome c peroxidase [Chitinophagales bacterium]|nr:c-type cytochrome [Bacteroidota bacterium]MCB9043431.1 c-type cytochrome [Chitinophagales bacterium]